MALSEWSALKAEVKPVPGMDHTVHHVRAGQVFNWAESLVV